MTTQLSSFAAHLRERIAGVSKLEVRNAEMNDAAFNTLALELFSLQFAHNAAYRRICEARGVQPSAIHHWSGIPAVPTMAFKELDLTSLAAAERTTVFHSSGTTAQRPSRHFHSAESLVLYEASLWPWFRDHVLAGLPENGSLVVALTPPREQASHSSLVHMFETVRRHCGAGAEAFLGFTGPDGAWALDLSRVEKVFNSACSANQPVVLLGTAFNFVHLLDRLAERNLRFKLPPGSVVMETGGYKGRSRELAKAELHQLITERLAVPAARIICEYGMSELSSQAYDAVTGGEWRVASDGISRHAAHVTRHFQFPPWARAQMISPETGREVGEGEAGLLRIFDLANAFSVLAIQTEDFAVRWSNGFDLLGRAVAAEPRGCSLMATDLPSS